jgi:NNP family nitrate/nitrite transporter-like MFS transporter
MGFSKQYTGTFSAGFLSGAVLSIAVLIALGLVMKSWTTTWVGEGGRALVPPTGPEAPSPVSATPRRPSAAAPGRA